MVEVELGVRSKGEGGGGGDSMVIMVVMVVMVEVASSDVFQDKTK